MKTFRQWLDQKNLIKEDKDKYFWAKTNKKLAKDSQLESPRHKKHKKKS